MVVDNMRVVEFLPEDDCMDNCPTDPYLISSPENLLDVLRSEVV